MQGSVAAVGQSLISMSRNGTPSEDSSEVTDCGESVVSNSSILEHLVRLRLSSAQVSNIISSLYKRITRRLSYNIVLVNVINN
mmetsp:Transcript_21814/g.44295  ORF Transcript_21814/g.44295 Transcript_21814/m.44295 type:complete len:83 (-) Transcript_21814:103-351(-)